MLANRKRYFAVARKMKPRADLRDPRGVLGAWPYGKDKWPGLRHYNAVAISAFPRNLWSQCSRLGTQNQIIVFDKLSEFAAVVATISDEDFFIPDESASAKRNSWPETYSPKPP